MGGKREWWQICVSETVATIIVWPSSTACRLLWIPLRDAKDVSLTKKRVCQLRNHTYLCAPNTFAMGDEASIHCYPLRVLDIPDNETSIGVYTGDLVRGRVKLDGKRIWVHGCIFDGF
jgi:hypothetical protein